MSGTQPNAARKRPMLTITLGPEAAARLDEFAQRWGTNRSRAVERLVRDAVLPPRPRPTK